MIIQVDKEKQNQNKKTNKIKPFRKYFILSVEIINVLQSCSLTYASFIK